MKTSSQTVAEWAENRITLKSAPLTFTKADMEGMKPYQEALMVVLDNRAAAKAFAAHQILPRNL